MKKNRILALLLAVVMVISMIPTTVFATETDPTETTEDTVTETTTATTPVVVNETVPETTEATVAETTEATVPETTEETVPETTEETVPETTEETVPETTEETVPETTEETIPETTEETVPETTEETIPEELTKEDDASGVTIQVSGNIPEEVTLSTSYVREAGFFSFFGSDGPSFNTEIYDVISPLSEVAFAFDITLTNEDGSEWQPESGETVTVTLDVSPFEIEDGTKLGIAHDHEGTITKLGEYTVEGGKLTFETSGFSVFYGYTVDFEYDGEWHSIQGGDEIELSDLFLQLGIDRNVNNVTSVEFSDSELISVREIAIHPEDGGGKDWVLESLQPFTTEEFLTIAFDDGTEIVIKVYDANITVESLNGNYTVNNGQSIGACVVKEGYSAKITISGTVTLNGSIEIEKGASLTVYSSGTATLKRGANCTGYMFDMKDGAYLELNGDGTGNTPTLIIKGDCTNTVTGPVIECGDDNNVYDSVQSTIVIRDTKIMNNKHQDIRSGAINVTSGTKLNMELTRSIIEKCESQHGSAIYIHGSTYGTVDINRVIINNCVSTGDTGGTIRTNGGVACQVTIKQTVIKNNSSNKHGGGIYWNANGVDPDGKTAHLTIENSQIFGNKAGNLGGGIFNEANMTLKSSSGTVSAKYTASTLPSGLVGVRICDNEAVNLGGGICMNSYRGGDENYNSAGKSDLNLGANIIIDNNTSKNHGGGLALNINETKDVAKGFVYNINVNGTQFTNNKATNDGGGIYLFTNTNLYKANLNLNSGTIYNNRAKNGAGVYVQNTNVTFGAITVKQNEATENGGGLYLNQANAYGGTAKTTIASGIVTNNTATKFGGGIYQTGASGNCVVSGAGKITNNTAANGGGIYVAGSSKLTVNGGIVTENMAVCHNKDGSLCSIHGENTALANTSGVGGGIYVADNSTFIMNADSGDVGLYANKAEFAADDAYASGVNTKLTIPGVGGMTIENEEFARLEGWFLDYYSSDSNFAKSGYSTNPGRYRAPTGLKKLATKEGITDGTAFYCLTLGKTPALIIEKTIPGTAKPDQSFRFHLKGANGTNIDTWVTLNPDDFKLSEGGESMVATVTVGNVPVGDVTVTEDVAWSWRYRYDSCVVAGASQKTDATNGVTIGMTTDGGKVTFSNSRDNIYWLDFEDVLSNIFKAVTNS